MPFNSNNCYGIFIGQKIIFYIQATFSLFVKKYFMKKTSFSNQLFVICFLFSFSFSTSFAQQNLSIEKLWQLGRVSDQQVSPDGKTVIFGVKNYYI